jgi:hypothetical protein
VLRTGGSQIVGGTAPAARNLITGTGSGVFIQGSNGNQVQGNLIGTIPAGTAASSP